MRRLSSRTHVYGSTQLHKFFVMPPIFQVKTKKKKRPQPTATCIMDHHLTFLQLLNLPYTPLPPLPLHEDYLNSLKNMICHAVLLSASKTLDSGAINLEGGASAPPLNLPLNSIPLRILQLPDSAAFRSALRHFILHEVYKFFF